MQKARFCCGKMLKEIAEKQIFMSINVSER